MRVFTVLLFATASFVVVVECLLLSSSPSVFVNYDNNKRSAVGQMQFGSRRGRGCQWQSSLRLANGSNNNSSSNSGSSSSSSREDEIRKKISELKREGRLEKTTEGGRGKNDGKNNGSREDAPRRGRSSSSSSSAMEDYADKIGSKLGSDRRGRQLGRMLGVYIPSSSSSSPSPSVSNSSVDDSATDDDDDDERRRERRPTLGARVTPFGDEYYDNDDEDEDYRQFFTEDELREVNAISSQAASDAIGLLRRNIDTNNEGEDEMDEEDMVNIVAKALYERGFRSAAAEEDEDNNNNSDDGAASTLSAGGMMVESTKKVADNNLPSLGPRTTGVGGTWSPSTTTNDDEQIIEDAYQPKVGTWGAFPRPKNISVAYGGGKRVGAGIKTDENLRQQSINDTKERLRAYRERMGIEVQSEKDHVDEIEEALALASRAMQRGSYGAGVSALEKVTQYCSTRSKLGGKVFLELAMAYEAEGKTDQALGLYAALTKSPIENIKQNADKLLYGLEAMNFMRNEAMLQDFSRKKAADTFIETTGFNDITKNFDRVYNTAYIDLDKGSQYYRMLTENAVRSTREARQVLLRAVSAAEVNRMKVVQALRSISRSFDEAALAERKVIEEELNIPVDYTGRPIVSTVRRSTATTTQEDLATAIGMDGYVLSKPSEITDKLDGEWKLQLMADKRGDRVEYFNTTLFWQRIDTSTMRYIGGMKGFSRSTTQTGLLEFDESGRILSRDGVSSPNIPGMGGNNLLSMFLGSGSNAGEMIKVPQQVLLIDSVLLVTRAIVKFQAADNVKDYYSVWRRVDSGTYSDI